MAAKFPRLDLPLYFAAEREQIRIKKERGDPAPWTDDPVMRAGSFCNVERERDRVTVWIREHWRDPYRDNPDVWFLMTFARLINAPEVLGAIALPLPWDCGRTVAEMAARKAQGLSLERAAYMIPAGPRGKPKYRHLAETLFDPLWAAREHVRPRSGNDLCQAFYERLLAFDGLGTFLAAQIVADVKYTPGLSETADWWTFVASGPGSRRGLNVVMGRDPEATWAEHTWRAAFDRFSAEIEPGLAELGLRLHAQDRQNLLCETFKLWRARTTGQMPRRKYAGTGENPRPKTHKAKPAPPPIEMPAPIEPPAPAPRALPLLGSARDLGVPHTLFHDVETRATLDLKAVGAHRYAADPGTEVLCVAYAVDASPCSCGSPVTLRPQSSSRRRATLPGHSARTMTHSRG
jgi:hypothetical protein